MALLGWMSVIFWLSHQPADELMHFGGVDFFVKKAGHFIGYAALGALAFVATGRIKPTIAIVVLHAIGDEYHQTFVPGRSGDIFDVLIDWAGAGWALWARRWWWPLASFLTGQRA